MELPDPKVRVKSAPEVPGESSAELPDYVLNRIFRFFSEPGPEIRAASRHWTSSGQNPFIWVKLVFRGDRTSADMICHILQNAPMLESLKLIKVPDVVIILRQLCRCKHRLKRLAVRFCHSGKDRDHLVAIPESTLRNVISCCPLLTSLDIEGTPFLGKLFYEELVHLRRLRTLRLGSNSLLSPRNIQTVAGVCRGRITHFSIMQCSDGPPKEVHFCEGGPHHTFKQMIANRRGVHEISYPQPEDNLPLTNADCVLLLRMLGPKLLMLELDVAGLDAWALQGLLTHCRHLRCLRLINAIKIPGEVVRQIPLAMPKLSQLLLNNAHMVSSEDLLGFFERREEMLSPLEEEVDILESGSVAKYSVVPENAEVPEKQWWEWGFEPESDEDESDEGTSKEEQVVVTLTEQEAEEAVEHSTSKGSLEAIELAMCSSIDNSFLHALAHSPVAACLKRLGLRRCQLVTEEGLELLKSCPKLKYLDVSFVNRGNGPSLQWLKAVSEDFPQLGTLIVGWNRTHTKQEDTERKQIIEELAQKKTSLSVKHSLSYCNSRLVSIKKQRKTV